MKWSDSYRKLFFDYHNKEVNHSLASEFDAVLFAEKLKEVGCEMTSVFAIGGRGHRYYRKGDTGVIHPQLPPGLDMVEDVVRECHKRNIKVLAYVNPNIPYPYLKEHPELAHWITPEGGLLNSLERSRPCKLGLGGQFIMDQTREICRNYDIDYFFLDGSYIYDPCYCDWCRNSYRKASGRDIPLGKEDPHWLEYMDWFHKRTDNFRQGIRDAAHEGKPGIEVLDNWAYSYRSTDMPSKDVDYLFSDVPFANEVEGIGICTRSYALTGKKYEIHNTAFLNKWGEWGLKHPTALKREAALLLSGGTNVHMGYQFHPRFRVEDAVWDAFKEVFDFTRDYEPYLENNEIIPYVGAYFSKVQHGLTHTGDLWSEPLWLYGFHKLMIDSGLHYNMLNSGYMKETIDNFPLVFLPDVRALDGEEINVLENYVREGGCLVASGLPAVKDDDLNPVDSRLADLLGLEWLGGLEGEHTYLKLTDPDLTPGTSEMALTMSAPAGLVKPVTAEGLAELYTLYKCSDGTAPLRFSPADEKSEYAGITLNKYGKGQAVYVAPDMGAAYYNGYQWNLTEIVKNLLYRKFKITPRLRVTDDGTCETTLSRRGEIIQVHLVNMVGTMPNTMETEARCMIRDVVPLTDVNVRVSLNLFNGKTPGKVIMRPGNREIPFSLEGREIAFRLDRVGLYELVEIIPQ